MDMININWDSNSASDELAQMSVHELKKLHDAENDPQHKLLIEAVLKTWMDQSVKDGLENILSLDAMAFYEAASVVNIKDVLNRGDFIKLNMAINNNETLSPVQKNFRILALDKAFVEANVSLGNQRILNEKTIAVANALNSATHETISRADVLDFNQADKAGVLENVDSIAKDKFRENIKQLSDFAKVGNDIILANDNRLANALNINDLKIEDIVKNHEMFNGLSDIKVDVKNGDNALAGEEKQKVLDTFKANAFLRATYDALADEKFYEKYKDNDNKKILEYFQSKIKDNYLRSLGLAHLTTKNTTGITVNRNTGEVELPQDVTLPDENFEIDYLTAACDTQDLKYRTAANEQALLAPTTKGRAKDTLQKLKNLQLMNTAKKVAEAASVGFKGVVKSLTSRKGLVNMGVVLGTSTLMFASAPAMVATGAVLYAGWSVINSRVMPVYDRAVTNLRRKGDWKEKKLGEKLKAIKAEWKNAKTEVESGTRFKERAKSRILTSSLVGGAAIASSLLSGGVLGTRFARQGVTLAGSGWDLHKTKQAIKHAKDEYNQNRSLAKMRELLDLEAQKKQDKVKLATIAAAAVFVDTGAAAAVSKFLFGGNEGIGSSAMAASVMNASGGEPIYSLDDYEVADTTAVETSINEEVAVDDGGTVAVEQTDINNLTPAEAKMFAISAEKWGADAVQGFYSVINSGNVESLPEGMSAVEFVDKLTRLRELAPGYQAKAIAIMIRDIKCPEYTPTAEEIATVKSALDNIVYQEGTMNVIVNDANGNPCETKVSMWGQYVGRQVMAKLSNGEDVPLRTPNVTTALNAEVDCGGEKAIITSVYKTNHIDCGCKEQEVVQQQPAPKVEAPRVETVVKHNPPHFNSQYDADDAKVYTVVKGKCDEVQIYSGKGSNIDRETAIKYFADTYENTGAASWIKEHPELTEENMGELERKLPWKDARVSFNKDTGEYTVSYTAQWKLEGAEGDPTCRGVVNLGYEKLYEGLANGNYGDHTIPHALNEATRNAWIAEGKNNAIDYLGESDDGKQILFGANVAKSETLSLNAPVNVNAESLQAVEVETEGDKGCCFTGLTTKSGQQIEIHMEDGKVTITDTDANPLMIAKADRPAVEAELNKALAGLTPEQQRYLGKVHLDPKNDTLQYYLEQSMDRGVVERSNDVTTNTSVSPKAASGRGGTPLIFTKGGRANG